MRRGTWCRPARPATLLIPRHPRPLRLTEGQLPEEQLPEEQLSEGPLPEGPLPEAQLPEAQLPEEQLPEGPLPEGPLPEGPLRTRRVPAQLPARRTRRLRLPQLTLYSGWSERTRTIWDSASIPCRCSSFPASMHTIRLAARGPTKTIICPSTSARTSAFLK